MAYILRDGNNNVILDASTNSSIFFKTNNTNRLRITDASSIFLNSLDLSGNNLSNVNNLTVSRANPEIDVSFNFTIVSLASNSTSRNTKIPNPYVGQMCFLTSSLYFQIYFNGIWNTMYTGYNLITPSGTLSSYMTTTFVDSGNNIVSGPTSGGSVIYTFKDTSATAPGTTRPGTITFSLSGNVTYLVVAGGGGGGGNTNFSGGGGAGGLLTGTLSILSGTSYTLSVGAGGTFDNNGSSSVFSSITSTGGGAGGGSNNASGITGGSGGGGAGSSTQPTNTPQINYGLGTVSQGNRGGGGNRTGGALGDSGGGGGGAGAVGGTSDGTLTSNNGGIGLQSNIQGLPLIYYAGGGGGRGGGGGQGGGGGVTNGSSQGYPGTNGLGGGGQGGGNGGANGNGSGGSGLVIIRISV